MRVRVATLPPGEDPDTLVRVGGAAALEPILTDAVDLLERKIQLLERKGWFEGMDHQRDALDRLLPTIRATADPISRDLYVKMVSERTGVSREVLLQQAAAKPAPAPTPPPGSGPRQPTEATRRPQARRRVSSAERDLLRVLIKDRVWLERAAAEVPAEWFETPELREVYETLKRSPENAGSSLFLERLSPPARQAWAWLDSIEPKYGAPDPDRTYVDACRTLEARPLVRQLNVLTRKIREEAAALAAPEFDALIQERSRLKQELTSRFPEEMLKGPIRRGDLDAH
jgi:DNA primase